MGFKPLHSGVILLTKVFRVANCSGCGRFKPLHSGVILLTKMEAEISVQCTLFQTPS